jgi:hypothetical protein
MNEPRPNKLLLAMVAALCVVALLLVFLSPRVFMDVTAIYGRF